MIHLLQPIHSKVLIKLAILFDYKRSQILCIALLPFQKVPKLDFQGEFCTSKKLSSDSFWVLFFQIKGDFRSTFLLSWFFGNPNFIPTLFTKIMPFCYWWVSVGICKYRPSHKSYDLLYFECSHWLKLQLSDRRANLVKEGFFFFEK